MSLRTYIATHVLAGLPGDGGSFHARAEKAVMLADALIEALNAEPEAQEGGDR